MADFRVVLTVGLAWTLTLLYEPSYTIFAGTKSHSESSLTSRYIRIIRIISGCFRRTLEYTNIIYKNLTPKCTVDSSNFKFLSIQIVCNVVRQLQLIFLFLTQQGNFRGKWWKAVDNAVIEIYFLCNCFYKST